jgi:hypothetical protein
MADSQIQRGADFGSLGTLPSLTEADRLPLERLLWMAPDVAWSTAAAVIRSHQAEAHELITGQPRDRSDPEIARLARSMVYLGLAIAAPGQGKLLPTLSKEAVQRARAQAAQHFALWNAAGLVNRRGGVEEDGLPDPELRLILLALADRASVRSQQDPLRLRGIVFSEASALYAAMATACREQFGGAVNLDLVNAHLLRISRTRDMIADALAPDRYSLPFDPGRQRELVDRLRRYGWEEHVASQGRTLAEIAAEAGAARFTSRTEFALSDEWEKSGASIPTTGQRYFIRPSLLPDSGARALWAQEERLKPLQKMLAGSSTETGLKLGLASVELLLEYASRHAGGDFLQGQWTRTINRFSGMQVRFGDVEAGRYSITLFPASRLDAEVGICPIIEVIRSEV